jgi:hypothetical protein
MLKVMTEGGTEEDYAYIVAEAGKDYLNKLKEIISRITKAVLEFIEKCKRRILELSMSVKTKLAMAKIERACKDNPSLRNITVEVINHEAITKAYNTAINNVSRIAAHEAASGRNLNVKKIEEQLDAIENKVDSEITKIKEKKNKITLATAIGLFKKYGNTKDANIMPDPEVVDFNSTANQLFKNISDDDSIGPEAAHTIMETTQLQAKLAKDQAAHTVSAHNDYLSVIKLAISGSKSSAEESKKESTSKESTSLEGLDMDSYYTEMMNEILGVDEEDYMTEGANVDMLKTYRECFKSAKVSLKEARKALKADDFSEAKRQVKLAETKLNEGKKAYKKVLASYDTDNIATTVMGILLHNILEILKSLALIIVSIPVGGVVGVVYAYYTSLKDFIDIISKVVHEKTFTIETLNTNKNHCDTGFKTIEKGIKNINDCIDAAEKAYKDNKKDLAEESVYDEEFENACSMFEAAYLEEYLNS